MNPPAQSESLGRSCSDRPVPRRRLVLGDRLPRQHQAFDRSTSKVSRNEHTTWMSSDPHSRAFQVLFNERSGASSASSRVSRADTLTFRGRAVPRVPHDAPAPSELKVTAWLNADGWAASRPRGLRALSRSTHHRAWKQKSRREKEDQWGLSNTKDLTSRGLACGDAMLVSTRATA